MSPVCRLLYLLVVSLTPIFWLPSEKEVKCKGFQKEFQRVIDFTMKILFIIPLILFSNSVFTNTKKSLIEHPLIEARYSYKENIGKYIDLNYAFLPEELNPWEICVPLAKRQIASEDNWLGAFLVEVKEEQVPYNEENYSKLMKKIKSETAELRKKIEKEREYKRADLKKKKEAEVRRNEAVRGVNRFLKEVKIERASYEKKMGKYVRIKRLILPKAGQIKEK